MHAKHWSPTSTAYAENASGSDSARKMGVKPESLSRSLNGLPRIDTIEKIAKALDVSIKSLFEDPVAIEGFVSVGGGKAQRFYSVREFERIVSENQPK